MHDFDINLSNISKIEGHTHLLMKVREGKVVECKLRISENQRFCKTAVEDMEYGLVPNYVSRICGTCSAAHLLASTEAIENAFGVNVSNQTYQLRKLLINGGHIRDHAMHLYFFVLPDIFNKESIFDFKGDLHKWVHYGLDVKEAGNLLSTVVGGRAVHPTFSVIGGFINFPTKTQMQETIEKLKKVRPKILELIEVLYKDKTIFNRQANYVSLINEDYNFIKGRIKTAKGTIITEEKYAEHIEKVVLPYSTAEAFTWESKDFMVGALARINLNKDSLHKKTKRDCAKYLQVFPSDCIFHNNLAQAIETLHAIDASAEILQNLIKTLKKENPINFQAKETEGVGVVEAPRGTLYYKLNIDKFGKIKKAKLVIPTQQNIIHLEKDVAKYASELLQKGAKKEEIGLKIEQMIRAYDPCMSCATHFLKIDWQ